MATATVQDTISAYAAGTMNAAEAATEILAVSKTEQAHTHADTVEDVWDQADDTDPFEGAWGAVNKAWAQKTLTNDQYLELSKAVDAQRASAS